MTSSWSNTPTGSMVPLSFNITATGRAPGGYTVYKVVFEMKVELVHGDKVFSKFEVWKRFSDFQQLSRQLEELHAVTRSSEEIPPLVKPSYFERFKEAVIEERRTSAVSLLRFASCQEHLSHSLHAFTEGAIKVQSLPFQQTPVVPTSTLIDKPTDTVPLSRLLKDSPQLTRTVTKHTALRGGRKGGKQDTGSSKEGEYDIRSNNGEDTGGNNEGEEDARGHKEEDNIRDNKRKEEEDSVSKGFVANFSDGSSSDEADGPSVEPTPDDSNDTSSPVLNSASNGAPVGGDGWWTEAMAATDDLDNLVDQLEGRGESSLSTLNTQSGRKSRSPSPGRKKGPDYIAQAGKLITTALSSESSGDYQAAFDLLKAGVDLLLNGVQTDASKRRREIVSRKTAEYLQHAEVLYQEHLTSKPPIASKPHLLPDFKVVGFLEKVLLVESRHSGQRFVIKVLYKSLQAMTAVSDKGRTTTNRATGLCKHMVKLLHHYETPNHRVFLLLEYAARGRLVDYVAAKRSQWQRLHDAVTNPHPSSSLIQQLGARSSGDDDMDDMLLELSKLAPPTSCPLPDSEEESTEGEDSLTLLRQRLEAPTVSLTVQPPTPTDAPVAGVSVASVPVTVQPPTPADAPVAGVSVASVPVTAPLKPSPAGSGCSTPRFSPGRASPVNKVDDWALRLEDNVREWGAQVTLAIEHLHSVCVVCGDLNPANVLLSDSGKAVLTYFSKWDFVEPSSRFILSQQLYTAPELGGLNEPTESCDWWSLGAVLFEILTGKTLLSCHPEGVHSHLPLTLPIPLSPEATSLLKQLLTVNPSERLGSGLAGAEEVKAHMFFTDIDWDNI